MQAAKDNFNQNKTFVQVAVPAPLYSRFDYLVPPGLNPSELQPGCRIKVPFGRRSQIGIILGLSDHSSVAASKLKPLQSTIDTQPVLPAGLLELLTWASQYYQHPIGEVIQTALPVLLRQGKSPAVKGQTQWFINKTDIDAEAAFKRAPKQQQLYQLLQQHPDGMSDDLLNQHSNNWRSAMKALREKGLVVSEEKSCLPDAVASPEAGPLLNIEQQHIIDSVQSHEAGYRAHLVHGITGSGKTEVYIALAEHVLAAGKQVLVLVPEISLTPQLTERFRNRLGVRTATMHSAMNDSQRLCAWTAAACLDSAHTAELVIGTRSAVFTPMPRLGLIIVDEEHDGSYKQQDGFRYNARDLALVRAQRADIPVVMGSATPSLESLYNSENNRYLLHTLKQRARAQAEPRIELLDLCKQKLQEGLSPKLLQAIDRHINNDGQVLLFLNRRGFSPLLMCHDCGWTTACRRCDAHMTYHKGKQLLRCHHCGAEAAVPRTCGDCGGNELVSIGFGTERIEQLLQSIHGFAAGAYDRSVDSHIKNLRRKIERDPRQPRYIQTVYGVGYRFVER